MEKTMNKFAHPNKVFTPQIMSVAAAVLLCSASAVAQQSVNLALSGASEVPAVSTSASGSGQFSVAADHTLSGKFTVSGITATAAHVHEAAAGANGPVIVKLAKNADGSFMVPPGTKLNDAQYASFVAGNLYVNVHSDAHPGGEIRAQLLAGGAAAAPMRSGY
jgi:hypothetical protein